MSLQPGDILLNGQYRILRLLGRGGFGFVYLAQDTLLHEEVALKELIPALVGDAEMLKRFLAEAKATMRLRHERIVATHNVFSERDSYHIVMEYLPGGSLEERLRVRGALPVDESVHVAADIAEGLAYAHSHGVVHCDLKPANILFTADGHAKIADFGIAHLPREMFSRSWATSSSLVAGTLPYMSPEQADGVRDDPRADLYALGAVLYRMLTGRTYLEFDEQDSPGAQARNVGRIQRELPVPPSNHNRRVPPWLDAVTLKALAKRSAERYATAEQFRSALLRRAALNPSSIGQAEAEKALQTSRSQPGAATPDLPRRMSSDVRDGHARPPRWIWLGAALFAPGLVVAVWVATGDGWGFHPTPTATAAGAIAADPLTHTVTSTATPSPSANASASPTGAATSTRIVTPTPQSVTKTPTPPVTSTPLSATPTLGPGSTKVRGKDAMVMVFVPAGEFVMGSADSDASARADEKPQHRVYLDAFWIDRTAVTNAMFASFAQASGYVTDAERKGRGFAWNGRNWFDKQNWEEREGASWRHPNGPDSAINDLASHPAVQISWNDAVAYCRWAGGRLPTEAEWEKAARGTDGRLYPWGDAFDCKLGNFGGVDCDGYRQTAPVGRFPAGASPYGALDMAGNTWEWVADAYAEDYYARSPNRNPPGPDGGALRVMRGGSWFYGREDVRSARRDYVGPDHSGADTGFRCASSP